MPRNFIGDTSSFVLKRDMSKNETDYTVTEIKKANSGDILS
jgi:hypothetical protein